MACIQNIPAWLGAAHHSEVSHGCREWSCVASHPYRSMPCRASGVVTAVTHAEGIGKHQKKRITTDNKRLGSPFALIGETPCYIDDTGDNEADPQGNSNTVDAAEMPISCILHLVIYSALPVKYISFNEDILSNLFHTAQDAYLYIA